MNREKSRAGIIIPPGRRVWEYELRVAQVLAMAGYRVEFLKELGNIPTTDVRLNGVEYEIKSPERFNANTLEHTLKNALRQAPNIIIDSSRMNGVRDDKVCRFLVRQLRSRKQIKNLLFVTKRGKIIDIRALI